MALLGARSARLLRRRTIAGIALAATAVLPAALLTAAPANAVGGKPMVWGAYATGKTPELGRIETQLGAKFDVDHEYVTFGKDGITSLLGDDRAKHRMPYVNMAINCACHQGTTGTAVSKGYWPAVAKGAYDGWLNAQADAVKAWPGTFFITWQHEPEESFLWEGKPTDYVAAWRHIVLLFRARGATNARFVTSLLPISYRAPHFVADRFWPGADVVDAVGSTGYNWACSAHTGTGPGCDKGWKSFADVFGPVNDWVTSHGRATGKRWWVTETGTAEDPAQPGRKAQWINDMRTTADSWPQLTGIVFFYGSRSHDIFLPGTSATSLAAFKAAAHEWSG